MTSLKPLVFMFIFSGDFLFLSFSIRDYCQIQRRRHSLCLLQLLKPWLYVLGYCHIPLTLSEDAWWCRYSAYLVRLALYDCQRQYTDCVLIPFWPIVYHSILKPFPQINKHWLESCLKILVTEGFSSADASQMLLQWDSTGTAWGCRYRSAVGVEIMENHLPLPSAEIWYLLPSHSVFLI